VKARARIEPMDLPFKTRIGNGIENNEYEEPIQEVKVRLINASGDKGQMSWTGYVNLRNNKDPDTGVGLYSAELITLVAMMSLPSWIICVNWPAWLNHESQGNMGREILSHIQDLGRIVALYGNLWWHSIQWRQLGQIWPCKPKLNARLYDSMVHPWWIENRELAKDGSYRPVRLASFEPEAHSSPETHKFCSIMSLARDQAEHSRLIRELFRRFKKDLEIKFFTHPSGPDKMMVGVVYGSAAALIL
jgi:hypothetical protein